jgi:hypothetical protein
MKLAHPGASFRMTQSKATRSIIDTHRHIFGPKLLKKFIENIGFDDKKHFVGWLVDRWRFKRSRRTAASVSET